MENAKCHHLLCNNDEYVSQSVCSRLTREKERDHISYRTVSNVNRITVTFESLDSWKTARTRGRTNLSHVYTFAVCDCFLCLKRKGLLCVYVSCWSRMHGMSCIPQVLLSSSKGSDATTTGTPSHHCQSLLRRTLDILPSKHKSRKKESLAIVTCISIHDSIASLGSFFLRANYTSSMLVRQGKADDLSSVWTSVGQHSSLVEMLFPYFWREYFWRESLKSWWEWTWDLNWADCAFQCDLILFQQEGTLPSAWDLKAVSKCHAVSDVLVSYEFLGITSGFFFPRVHETLSLPSHFCSPFLTRFTSRFTPDLTLCSCCLGRHTLVIPRLSRFPWWSNRKESNY